MTITRKNRTKSAKAKAMGDGNNSKPKKPKKGKTSIADTGSVVAEGASESDDVTMETEELKTILKVHRKEMKDEMKVHRKEMKDEMKKHSDEMKKHSDEMKKHSDEMKEQDMQIVKDEMQMLKDEMKDEMKEEMQRHNQEMMKMIIDEMKKCREEEVEVVGDKKKSSTRANKDSRANKDFSIPKYEKTKELVRFFCPFNKGESCRIFNSGTWSEDTIDDQKRIAYDCNECCHFCVSVQANGEMKEMAGLGTGSKHNMRYMLPNYDNSIGIFKTIWSFNNYNLNRRSLMRNHLKLVHCMDLADVNKQYPSIEANTTSTATAKKPE